METTEPEPARVWKGSPDLEPFLVPIEDLGQLAGNPRRGDVQAIMRSLDRFGQRYGLVARDGELQAGNHRLLAARELGWTHLAVQDANDLTADEARAFALADNRTGDLGTYDMAALGEFLADLDDEDLLGSAGYSLDDLDELLNPAPAEDLLYSRKIDSPAYEPTMEDPPPVSDLYDTGRTRALLETIDAAGLPVDVADFLRAAAERHTRFRFDLIAEYYAHAPAEIQELMEESVLVIIDFDQAVERGFVQLSESLAAQYVTEYGDSDVGD